MMSNYPSGPKEIRSTTLMCCDEWSKVTMPPVSCIFGLITYLVTNSRARKQKSLWMSSLTLHTKTKCRLTFEIPNKMWEQTLPNKNDKRWSCLCWSERITTGKLLFNCSKTLMERSLTSQSNSTWSLTKTLNSKPTPQPDKRKMSKSFSWSSLILEKLLASQVTEASSIMFWNPTSTNWILNCLSLLKQINSRNSLFRVKLILKTRQPNTSMSQSRFTAKTAVYLSEEASGMEPFWSVSSSTPTDRKLHFRRTAAQS